MTYNELLVVLSLESAAKKGKLMHCFWYYDVRIYCSSKNLTIKSKAMSRGRKVILYFIDCILLYKTAVCKAVLMKMFKRHHLYCVSCCFQI